MYANISFDKDIEYLEFSPHDQFLLVRGQSLIHLYSVSTGQLFKKYDFSNAPYKTIEQSVFLEDSTLLVVKLDANTLKAYSLESGELIHSYTKFNGILDYIGSNSNQIAWQESPEYDPPRVIISPLKIYDTDIVRYFQSLDLPPIKKENVSASLYDILSPQG